MENLRKSLAFYIFERDNVYMLYDFYTGMIIELAKEVGEELLKVKEENCGYQFSPKVLRLFESGFISRRATKEEIPQVTPVAYLSFAPEYQCNLRCSYCFAEYGQKYEGNKRYFTGQDIKKVIDVFIDELFPNVGQYRIDFVSGGEPLLRFDVVKEAILYVETKTKETNKKVTIWLCTNGILLNEEICDFLNQHNVSIGISLDGKKESNDKNRRDILGKGTYDTIVDRIRFIQNNKNYSTKFRDIWCLCTATNDNCNFVDILEHFADLDINNLQIRMIRDEKKYDVQLLKRQYNLLTDFLIKTFLNGNEKYISMILNDNDQFGKVLKRIFLGETISRRCNAGINKITVCPDGEIYPCDSLVGYQEYRMGDLGEKSLDRAILKDLDVFSRIKCKECCINVLCGGDCYYNAYKKNGNINNVTDDFCILQKDIIENSIYIKYFLMKNVPQQFNKFLSKVKMKEEYRKIYG